ncbi:4298_t:CDS:2 [Entrophospora sp. SA101]|nr:4298_t:CDS:2 [Entrophospora sp. SA101]CAJ0876533.1 15851_t:CDS:2 [Entrophospora sp. SA101]CAJ0907968.1 9303_t:CDS:2 [Entrophospora sp. SA101]
MPRSSSSEDSEHLQDPDFLSNSASLFNLRDLRALKASFCSTDANDVIPRRTVSIPEEYILPNIDRVLLGREDLDISQLSQNNQVKTFINKLHKVVRNARLDIGTSEALTDTLVAHLIFLVIDFNQWPLEVKLHPTFKFSVGRADLSAKAEFVIDHKNYSILVVEDKHLANVKPSNNYGEPQIFAEMLACGEENTRQANMTYDVTIFVVRVISTYVTFYRSVIHKEYWDELGIGCPRQQSIEIFRWPGNSSVPFVGFDLAEPYGRRNVLEALCKIRQFVLEL